MATTPVPPPGHVHPATSDEGLDARIALGYLNSQLEANHEGSEARYKHYKTRKNLTEELKKTYAWARYASRGKSPANLHFGKPTVRFVCDHDAMLEFHIQDGKFGERPAHEITGKDGKVVLRATTERRTILGKDLKVGDYESRIHLLVFDFDHAKTVSFKKPDQEHTKEHAELDRQILGYARYLQAGGHHVLFFPPEFDEDLRTSVKFSHVAEKMLVPLTSIGGVSSIMINNYLSLLWFTCAFIARTEGETTQATWDARTSLATLRSWTVKDYNPKSHFMIRFGQPRVDILCAREVILYFTLSEISFFARGDHARVKKHKADYTGWVIALVIDVEVSDSNVMLKTETARYREYYSQYAQAAPNEHKQELIKFFVSQYVKLLGRTTLRYLYQRLREEHLFTHSVEDADSSWWMLEHGTSGGHAGGLDSTIRHTDMCGFDLAVAISQTSINNQLRLRFTRARNVLHSWSAGHAAYIEVKTISVILLPNSRAIVTVYVTEASLTGKIFDELSGTLVKENVGTTEIGECRLSFEVQLKSCSDDHLPPRHSSPKTHHPSGNGEYTLRHIYLDLENPVPDARRTSFGQPEEMDHIGSEYQSETSRATRTRRIQQTLLFHIMTSYFHTMMEHGLHVIATVPVYKYSPQSPSFYKFTRMSFVTSAFDEAAIAAKSEGKTTTRVEQILFVLGMTGEKVLPPNSVFKPSRRWIAHTSSSSSHGTFAINRFIFRDRLFALLARVNAVTTLVPVSPSYSMKTDENLVQQWALHPDFKDRECEWKPIETGDGLDAQTYGWKYSRDWHLHEEGTLLRKGEYLVSCFTSNELQIPDLTQLASGSFEVTMSGQMKLRVSSTQDDNTWSTESSAFWKVTIAIKTTGRGIVEVEIDGVDDIKQPPPKNHLRRSAISNIPDAYAILRGHLPKAEQFRSILTELKVLEGAWKYYYPSANAFTLCSPTFNFVGDLLFELRPGTGTTASVIPAAEHASAKSKSNGLVTHYSSIQSAPNSVSLPHSTDITAITPAPGTNGQRNSGQLPSRPASPQGDTADLKLKSRSPSPTAPAPVSRVPSTDQGSQLGQASPEMRAGAPTPPRPLSKV